MNRLSSLIVLSLCLATLVTAQTNFYFVSFTDKEGSDHIALSDKALSMREARAIAIDNLDWAVSSVYLDSLRRCGARICHTSRWHNGATVEMTPTLAEEMAAWTFVRDVECTRRLTLEESEAPVLARRKQLLVEDEPTEEEEEGPSYPALQLEMLHLNDLHERGYKGSGKTIAVIDACFPAIDTSAAFTSMREEGRWLGNYDFADYDIDFASPQGDHGALCLSILAAEVDTYTPAAPAASYYLMRTEEWLSETLKETDNWVAAIELADSLGVEIVSSSLGYCRFDQPDQDFDYEQMDGLTNRISLAATLAAQKGMLVCNSAGNTANLEYLNWPHIMAPGDGRGILTVGAVKTDTTYAPFSSLGPSADGRVKPDVTAMGYQTWIYDPTDAELRQGDGTSFACPQIAGLAACLWEALPHLSAQQIRELILRSAHQYETPDEYLGYGLPNALKALNEPTSIQEPMQTIQPASVRKIRYNGGIYILRNGRVYTLNGLSVRL